MSVTVPLGAHDAGSEPGRQRVKTHESSPAVVYLAAAQNTYGTVSYRRAMRRLAQEWPRAVVMDSEACGFASRADWYLRWPFIRDGIDCLVVLCEADGSISQETFLELRDASESGLRCWFLTGEGDLAPLATVHFRLFPAGTRTSRRWAHAVVMPAS